MKLIVQNYNRALELELADDMPLELLKSLLEADLNVPPAAQQLRFQGQVLQDDSASLGALGLKNGDVLSLEDSRAAAAAANLVLPGISQPAERGPNLQQARRLIQQMQADPYSLSSLHQNWPDMAEAIRANDADKVLKLMREHESRRRQQEAERRRLLANPDDPEAQRLIEEQIRMENVEALRQSALEHMPESFGSVVMLYVKVRVNGHDLKAFVDSGAQMTIMSAACAERCGITRLIDRRFQGVAVGVGRQKILGRVHMYSLEIAGDHLPTSFSILENQPMDMLLGLDMLRRHQCCIDLRQNRLLIGTTGHSTEFLGEAEIPVNERLTGAEAAEGAGGAGDASDLLGGQSAPSAPRFPAETVAELRALGNFSQAQVEEALTVCDGNKERAASYLLSNL